VYVVLNASRIGFYIVTHILLEMSSGEELDVQLLAMVCNDVNTTHLLGSVQFYCLNIKRGHY